MYACRFSPSPWLFPSPDFSLKLRTHGKAIPVYPKLFCFGPPRSPHMLSSLLPFSKAASKNTSQRMCIT